jgi:ankyrin
LAGHRDIAEILVKHGAQVNIQSPAGFTPLYMAAQENNAEVVKFLLDHGADQHIATQDGFTPMSIAVQQGHQTVVTLLMDNDESSHRRVKLPALHVAAKRDDVRAATLLLQAELPARQRTSKISSSVNLMAKNGFTALHMAAHHGSINVAELLIKCGADVNLKAQNGVSALHVASKWGRADVVALLADSNADIECQTRDLLTPLHCAARSGQDSTTTVLLNHGASLAAKTKNGLTPLHMAVQGDHVETARLILDAGADINDISMDYLTALHVAAHCGNVRVAELLLKYKCTVEPRALNGFTPLHVACKKNRIKIIELLLRYGANIDCTSESGLTPLHVSAFVGHQTIVSYLLENGAQPELRTVREETAVHVAARARQCDIMRLLLRHGAQVDARAKEQQSALHISSKLGDVDTVRVLLEYGASCDLATRDLYTPLHVAVKEGHDDLVTLLLEHGAKLNLKTKKGFTVLHIAAKYGHVTTMRLLVHAKNVNPDIEGTNGLTPLHIATHYNNLDVILVLLENNASPHCVAKNGYTPLHIAAKMNRIDIAKVLLRYEAKATAESRNGFTPLHLAAQEGHSEMILLLLGPAGKANVGSRAKNGLTAMHLAAQEDQVQVAEILVTHHSDIDPQTKAGYTPLHTACHFGQLNMVQFLLNHQANVNITTEASYTALHIAAQQGQEQIVDLLLNHGASPNTLTTEGQTALSIAKHLGFLSVVELLGRVTEVTVATPAVDYMYNIVYPETMQELLIDSDDEGKEETFMSTPKSSRRLPDDDSGTSPYSSIYRQGKTQEDLFAFEDHSGRQSTISWSGSYGTRDYLTEELRYMREYDSMTPSFDGGENRPAWNDDRSGLATPDVTESMMMMTPGIFTPGTEDGDMRYLLRMDSRPLADEGMTPETTLTSGDSGSGVEHHPLKGVTAKTEVARLYSRLARRAHSEDMMDENQESDDAVVIVSPQTSMWRTSELDSTSRRTTWLSSVYSESSAGSGLLSERVVRNPVYSGFLVSFVVDARGAVMTGRRHSGIRLIIPPNSTSQPTRVTCKLVANDKLSFPPSLAEGESLANRVLDMGSTGVKFNSPVLIEVPHYASLEDKHREVCILRSDNGVSWVEHTTPATDEDVHCVLGANFDDLEPAEKVFDGQVVRILCTDVPHYFAVITRVRQESKTLGPAGGILSSTVVPQAQVIFPQDAIIKPIRVGLQVLPVSPDLVQQVLTEQNLTAANLSAGPIVTIEPRPRKFHQPISVTVPLPPDSTLRGMSASAARERGAGNTLRVLCSMSGCHEATEWVDVTGSSPLKLTNDCVSFTTAVSARFWLIDCMHVENLTHLANQLFSRLIQVPYLARFVVYARRPSLTQVRLRLLCVTDDKVDKTLEKYEQFTEVACSNSVQVVNGKTMYVRVPGMIPIMKSDDDRLCFDFTALRENRLHLTSRIRRRDVFAQVVIALGNESMQAPPDRPICSLEFQLPAAESEHDEGRESKGDDDFGAESIGIREIRSLTKRRSEVVSKAELRLTDIAEMVHSDWPQLAAELGMSTQRIDQLLTEFSYPSEQALVMLQEWTRESSSVQTTGNVLQLALQRIGRDDVVDQCMRNVQVVTDQTERDEALAFLDQELSSAQTSSMEVVEGIGEDIDLELELKLASSQQVDTERPLEFINEDQELDLGPYVDSKKEPVAQVREVNEPASESTKDDKEPAAEVSEDIEPAVESIKVDKEPAVEVCGDKGSTSESSEEDQEPAVEPDKDMEPAVESSEIVKETAVKVHRDTASAVEVCEVIEPAVESVKVNKEPAVRFCVDKESSSESSDEDEQPAAESDRDMEPAFTAAEPTSKFYDEEIASIMQDRQECENTAVSVASTVPCNDSCEPAAGEACVEMEAVLQSSDVEITESSSNVTGLTSFETPIIIPASSYHADFDTFDSTDGFETEEVLPDGSVVRRRVITTTTTTTRQSVKRHGTIDLGVIDLTSVNLEKADFGKVDSDKAEDDQKVEQSGSGSSGNEETVRRDEDVADAHLEVRCDETVTMTTQQQLQDDAEVASLSSASIPVDEEVTKSPPPSPEDLNHNKDYSHCRTPTATDDISNQDDDVDNDDVSADAAEQTMEIVIRKQVHTQRTTGHVTVDVTHEVTMTHQSDDVTRDAEQRASLLQQAVDEFLAKDDVMAGADDVTSTEP